MMPKVCIVSITPLPLQKDSRTLKIAKTFQELGYNSYIWDTGACKPYDIRHRSANIVAPKHAQDPTGSLSASAWGIVKKVLSWLGLKQLMKYLGIVIWARTTKELFGRFSLIQKNLPKADIYYLHSIEFGIVVLWRYLTLRIPYIYDAHDYYVALHGQKWWQPLFLLERLLIRYASNFVTVSEGVADLYEQTFHRRPLVIPNTQYLPKQTKFHIRSSLKLARNDILIVSICRPVEGRSIWPAIDAIAAIKNPRLHLAFIGEGYETHKAMLIGSKIEKQIHFLPPRSPETITDFIATADFGYLPYHVIHENIRNALPNGFFQCIAAGLPILYNPELVEIHKICTKYPIGVKINPMDTSSILNALAEIAKSSAMRKALKNYAKKAAMKFSWAEQKQNVKSLIADALRSAGHPNYTHNRK